LSLLEFYITVANLIDYRADAGEQANNQAKLGDCQKMTVTTQFQLLLAITEWRTAAPALPEHSMLQEKSPGKLLEVQYHTLSLISYMTLHQKLSASVSSPVTWGEITGPTL
jgi:hypothetical protein